MTHHGTVPRDHYGRRHLPKKIITKPLRQTTTGAPISVVADLGSIDQVPSTSRTRRDSNQSQRRNRSLAAANSSTCCKCALASAMVLLTASLIATIFVPFLLVRSEADVSTAASSIASSLSYNTVPGISVNTTGGTLSVGVNTTGGTLSVGVNTTGGTLSVGVNSISSLTSVSSITNSSLAPSTVPPNSTASSGSTTNMMTTSSLSSTSSASPASVSTTTTETTSLTPLMTSTTVICGTAATACTGCTSSCSSGLILSLTQASSSAWTAGGNGYTTYGFSWLAPAATLATIQFQFYTTTSGNYWDLDSISVKDLSGTEAITNGGLSSKSSWTETCGIGSCASIQNYGVGLTPMYWVNCISSSNYYSVSQTFPTVPCGSYNISFVVARYKGSANIANAFVYIY